MNEHILVAEKALGHYLPPKAIVHHRDENPRNNAPGNLVICQDQKYHLLLHTRTRVYRAGGRPGLDKICAVCRKVKPVEAFSPQPSNAGGRCAQCRECRRKGMGR